MAKIAVVILNYNGVVFLKKFLSDVVKYSPEADVFVADNASTDDSLDYIHKIHPTVKCIQFADNQGFTGGYNRVMQQMDSEYCVLLNSDVEVSKNWLKPLVHFLETNQNVAACQPKIKDQQNRAYFEYAGAAGGFIDAFGFPFCRGRIFETLEVDRGQYDNSVEVFWASGACMMIRVKDYLDAGGFDDRFFAHMEEIDLCWRLQMMGKKIYCVTESTVYHVGAGTLSKSNSRKTYLNFRNNLLMIIKNEPFLALLIKLPIKLILDWLAAIKFWKEESIKHFWAILLAHLHTVLSITYFIKKRRDIRRVRTGYTSKRKPVLLVWRYFLSGQKKYTDIIQ